MSRRKLAAAAAALVLCASHVSAQDTTGAISLELNRASASPEGGCSVVFFGKNGLDQALQDVSWRLALFDADGVFINLLSLPLGDLSAGKRRIVRYNLPAACTEMSEIIVNDVATCKIDGVSDDDAADLCLSSLDVTSRTDIAFGL
ncbi:hypothetical protein [uncultured Tateyamaria sp.]|uniref:hypothetical protein n=1 Tax=Tateyamaria sp. 1078 TaxID=3417464 RepID=UPI00261DA06A|nr:hypothetical protein [uncultured Tateyamaria sp.]